MSEAKEDLVWIRLHVEAFTGEATDHISVARAEWDAMTADEHEKWLVEVAEEHIANHAFGGAWVVDESEVPESEQGR